MSEGHEGNPHHDGGPRPPDHFTQDFKHTPISARVPEKVSRGVFSTAVMILQTNEEFVIDFLSTMVLPHQVVARVVLSATTFAQFIAALRANIAKYEQQFGPLVSRQPLAPGPPGPAAGGVLASSAPAAAAPSPGPEEQTARQVPEPGPQPRIEDLYDQLRLPDEMLGGVFANVVMMRHTPEDFCFDFIASFYPRSVVASRVYLAAGRIPSFIDALSSSYQKFQQRVRGGPPQAPPAPSL